MAASRLFAGLASLKIMEKYKSVLMNLLIVHFICCFTFVSYGEEAHSNNNKSTNVIVTNRPYRDNSHHVYREHTVEPFGKDGKLIGLLIVKVDTLWKPLELECGDIILKCDDVDLNSLDNVMNFYSDLKTAQKLSIQISRKGKIITNSYTFTD